VHCRRAFQAPAKLVIGKRPTGEHDHRDAAGEQNLRVLSDRFV
jgi:hypothetical protein